MNQRKRWTIILGIVLLVLIAGMVIKGSEKEQSGGSITQNGVKPQKVETDVAEQEKVSEMPTEKPMMKEKDRNDESDKKENKKSDAGSQGDSEEPEKTEGNPNLPKQSKVEKKQNKKSKQQPKGKATQSPQEPRKQSETAPTGTPAKAPDPTKKPDVTPIPQKNICQLSITCKDVLSHMNQLSNHAKVVIPKDGNILSGSYEVKKGDTVFDVLKRACKENNILLDFQYTAMYDSYYIKGIHNLYEFDCGAESGWMFTVDGQSSGLGCNQCILYGGEEIVFYFTCEK